MTKRRFRLPETQTTRRQGWLGLLPRVPVRRRSVAPEALPDRPVDAESYVHMRYARTLPLHARGDLELSRRKATLSFVAPILDGLLIEPTQPLSMLRLLNRSGFVPARDADRTMLLTALYELALQLGWRVYEWHPALSDDEHETQVRWPSEDFCIAPIEGNALLRVRVAGNGLQLAAYLNEPLSQTA